MDSDSNVNKDSKKEETNGDVTVVIQEQDIEAYSKRCAVTRA